MLLLLTCVGGGVIINVAVAWGCAMWSPQITGFTSKPIDCPDAWPAYLDGTWPAPIQAEERVVPGPGSVRIGASDFVISCGADTQSSAEDRITTASLWIHCFGLPARSLQWEIHGLNAGSRSIELLQSAAKAAGWRRGVRVFRRIDPTQPSALPRRLPVTPIWSGFVINTIVYAAILWLLLTAPGFVRRSIRSRRGGCLACGHTVGASSVCSECGATVHPRAPRR